MDEFLEVLGFGGFTRALLTKAGQEQEILHGEQGTLRIVTNDLRYYFTTHSLNTEALTHSLTQSVTLTPSLSLTHAHSLSLPRSHSHSLIASQMPLFAMCHVCPYTKSHTHTRIPPFTRFDSI